MSNVADILAIRKEISFVEMEKVIGMLQKEVPEVNISKNLNVSVDLINRLRDCAIDFFNEFEADCLFRLIKLYGKDKQIVNKFILALEKNDTEFLEGKVAEDLRKIKDEVWVLKFLQQGMNEDFIEKNFNFTKGEIQSLREEIGG